MEARQGDLTVRQIMMALERRVLVAVLGSKKAAKKATSLKAWRKNQYSKASKEQQDAYDTLNVPLALVIRLKEIGTTVAHDTSPVLLEKFHMLLANDEDDHEEILLNRTLEDLMRHLKMVDPHGVIDPTLPYQ